MLQPGRSDVAGRFTWIRRLRPLAVAALSLMLAPNVPGVMAQTAPSVQAPAPNSDPFGEDVVLAGKPIVFISGKATWDSAFPTLKEKFTALARFLDAQKLKAAGPMMTIYTSVYNEGFTFQAAVPLDEQPANLPRGIVTAGQSPVGKALKFFYRGSYDAMDMFYESITNFLDEKRIERQGLFVEEYVTNPLTTPEEKLQVNVFVLVK